MSDQDVREQIAAYRPRLVVYARSWGRALAREAEDAAHEIIERAIARVDRYDGAHAISTWVYQIAHNYCTDRSRAAGRRRRILSEHAPVLVEAEQRRSPSPAEQAERNQVQQAVREYVDSLPPEDRRIAFLRFYEELPLAEIATTVGMPVGTVKYRVHQIKAGLRARLEAIDEAE